jgi:predicted transposase/invertase (TIGR01784 family)
MYPFVDPKVDIAFKKIFGNTNHPEVLISFLNAVLEKNIVAVEILNPYQAPKIELLKTTILDVKARDKWGNEFIVEMQANPYYFFDKRALNYISNAYINQVPVGTDYAEHKPVYFIGVLNFNFFKSEKYLSKHFFINQENNKQEISLFELYFIELKKFTLDVHELVTILDKWTYFIQKAGELQVMPTELVSVPEIKIASESAARFKWETEELEYYARRRANEAAEAKLIADFEALNKLSEVQRQELEKNQQIIQNAVIKLNSLGIAPEEIANTLNITLQAVQNILKT